MSGSKNIFPAGTTSDGIKIMLTRLFNRICGWPALISFHFKRTRFRVKSGTIRIFDPLSYIVSLYWMQLGKYHQYTPRAVKYDILPIHEDFEAWPTIAIVTPSYNQASYLEETIQSVLNQKYQRLQYAVVDGGSNDGSASIIDRHMHRLTFSVSEPDQGQSHAIVKGFEKVSGDIHAYLNSDDILVPGALHYVGAFFRQNPDVDVVYGHRIIVDEKTQEVGRWILPKFNVDSIKNFDYIPQETLFWRKTIGEKAGGINPEYHFAMDWDFILRLHGVGARFQRLPYFIGCFRVHEVQKSQAAMGIGKKEIEGLMKRSGGDESFGRDFHRADMKMKRKAFFTSMQIALGLRR